MQTRTLVTSAVAIAGIAVGAIAARSVTISHGNNVSYSKGTTAVSSPAVQATGSYVFACVNKSGKIDYLEFRLPLPHQCWFSGEALWHLAAAPAAAPSPSASASPSSSPSASASPSASVSPSVSAVAVSSSASVSSSAPAS